MDTVHTRRNDEVRAGFKILAVGNSIGETRWKIAERSAKPAAPAESTPISKTGPIRYDIESVISIEEVIG